VYLAHTSNANAFDVTSYCRQVSDAVGGSYQIEKTCREQEYRAKNNVDRMHTSSRIEKYCNEVANAVGGSYSIMETCIKQETEAMQSLR
jgi:phytoene/squalene synthetase